MAFSCLLVFYLVVLLRANRLQSQQLFGTKTPYHHGNLSHVSTPDGCKAVHLNMLLRHGYRYPSNGDMKSFAKLLREVNQIHNQTNQTQHPFKYKNLTFPWKLPEKYYRVEPNELSEAGERELYGIAKRFLAKYPEVFSQEYGNSFYAFISSAKLRTVQSANSFAYGLFKGRGSLGTGRFQPVGIAFSDPEDKDPLLRSYKMCPLYDKEIDEGNGLLEFEKFGTRPEIRRVAENVQSRLSVGNAMEMSAKRVQKLLTLCAFLSVNNGDSSWCSLFEKEDIKVLEYYMDLEQYYEHSYGNEIAYRVSCPLVADIINTLRAFTTTGKPYGVFRFAHSGTLIGLQTILSMFNDSVPLKADNYQQQMNRSFRVSQNSPMAGNVAFVLFKCQSSRASAKAHEMRVQVLVNERPVSLPCCGQSGMCSLEGFLSCYSGIGAACDLTKICEVPVPETKPSPKSSATLQFKKRANRLFVVLVVMMYVLI